MEFSLDVFVPTTTKQPIQDINTIHHIQTVQNKQTKHPIHTMY